MRIVTCETGRNNGRHDEQSDQELSDANPQPSRVKFALRPFSCKAMAVFGSRLPVGALRGMQLCVYHPARHTNPVRVAELPPRVMTSLRKHYREAVPTEAYKTVYYGSDKVGVLSPVPIARAGLRSVLRPSRRIYERFRAILVNRVIIQRAEAPQQAKGTAFRMRGSGGLCVLARQVA
jgi:hypothetical protein